MVAGALFWDRNVVGEFMIGGIAWLLVETWFAILGQWLVIRWLS